jgi:Mg2+ and Co2+ transporter CorA
MKYYIHHKNEDEQLIFGIISSSEASEIFKKTDRYQFIPKLKPSLYPSSEDESSNDNSKLIINSTDIFYSGNKGTLYKHLFIMKIPANNMENICVRNNKSIQCNGILREYNIFRLELSGFRIVELSVFLSDEMNYVIIPDDQYDTVYSYLEGYWNKTYLSLGGSIILYLLILQNEKELKAILKDHERLSHNFLQKIIDLRYKDIEDFNFIISRYETNLINLSTIANYNNILIDQYLSKNNPFFSELFKNIGFKRLNKISSALSLWDRFKRDKIVDGMNKSCDCNENDVLINNIRFRSSGRYISELKHNVCTVMENCGRRNVLFPYGEGDNLISFTDDKGNPESYKKDIYDSMMMENKRDSMDIVRSIELLIERKDNLLSKTFEKLEFFNSRNMTILTVVSTIFLPISFISSWYGMNLMNIPEYDYMFMYPILTILTISIILGYLYFYKDVLFIKSVKYEDKRRRRNRN